MINSIVFATNNVNKLVEAKKKIGKKINLLSLKDIGFLAEIKENGSTLEQNALLKSKTVHTFCGCNCFSDDTGLMVEALDGAPGVISARFAGEYATSSQNVAKLIHLLKNESNRKAKFTTVISLIYHAEEYFFEGTITGTIALEPAGNKGFGYDSVFIPDGFTKTFAQFNMDEKNKLSHRAKALEKLVDFLNKQH